MATKPSPSKKSAPTAAKAKSGAKTSAPVVKAAVPASKPAPPLTVALKAVFAEVAAEQNLPKKQADALLSSMIAAVTTRLKNGDRIRMTGLGILEVKNREARTGRNPATGEAIQIAASKKIAFRAAKELK